MVYVCTFGDLGDKEREEEEKNYHPHSKCDVNSSFSMPAVHARKTFWEKLSWVCGKVDSRTVPHLSHPPSSPPAPPPPHSWNHFSPLLIRASSFIRLCARFTTNQILSLIRKFCLQLLKVHFMIFLNEHWNSLHIYRYDWSERLRWNFWGRF